MNLLRKAQENPHDQSVMDSLKDPDVSAKLLKL